MKVCPICNLQYPDEETHCFIDRAALTVVTDPLLGGLIAGRYLLEEELGAGSFARVYRARNTLTNQLVAVKVLKRKMAQNKEFMERFRREAKNTAAVAHPNIIEILDYGEIEDATFMVMELLDGETLKEVIARGPLPIDVAIDWAEQIAQGLSRAHDFAVFHRDLKPDNIFLHRGETLTVKILDFGVARSMHDERLTQVGQIFGTPQYMAPERISSEEAGGSADLYALGCILFEMVTGQPPFTANDMTALFVKHIYDPPPRPRDLRADVSEDLERLILSLLEKKPEDRPLDAHSVVKSLRALLPSEHKSGQHTIIDLGEDDLVDLEGLTPVRWEDRIRIFEEMVRRVYPAGDAPPAMGQALGAMRIRGIHLRKLRGESEVHQQALEAKSRETREGRERLGRAMQVLGSDLSNARQALRDAERWLEAKKREVADLEFQVRAVGQQLDRVEATREESRGGVEEALKAKVTEITELERDLPALAAKLTEPLRGRPELADLFAQLAGGRPEGPEVPDHLPDHAYIHDS